MSGRRAGQAAVCSSAGSASILTTPSVAELGYRLRRDCWGQGLATEGAAALVDWGFRAAGYDRIVACAMAANHGSRRVMEKLGMRHVRTEFPDLPQAIPGRDEGEVWYELTQTAWVAPEDG